MEAAIDVIANAFHSHYLGKTQVPLRPSINTTYGPTLLMPALINNFSKGQDALGLKVISIRKNNPQQNLPSVVATILLMDPETGFPLSLMDGSYLTILRTAAGSGAATKYLARKDTPNLVIFGAGKQASAHIIAMITVRPSIKKVWIVNRTTENSEILANQLRPSYKHIEFIVEKNPNVITQADIIVTATNASEPLFDGKFIKAGTHINCIGAYTPKMQEVDILTIKNSLVVVDTMEAALSEPGDIIIPLQQGEISKEHILAELGEVVHGKKIRTSDDQITLFKSCGNALQDVSVALEVYKTALQKGLGTFVEL